MDLCGEVVELVRADLLDQASQRGGVEQVAIVQLEADALDVWIHVEVLDTPGVEAGRPTDEPVDVIAARQQLFGEVGAVLSGDPGDQCDSSHSSIPR